MAAMQATADSDRIEGLVREGSEAVSRNDLGKAVAKYRAAYGLARESGRPAVLVPCACDLGAALLSSGEVEPAVRCLEQALATLLDREGGEEEEAEARNLRGDLSFNLGLAFTARADHDGASNHFGAAAVAFRACGEWKGFADACQQLGEQRVRLGRHAEAAVGFRDAAKGYLRSGRAFLSAKMVVRQAQNLYRAGEASESLQLLVGLGESHPKIWRSGADPAKLAKLFNSVGFLLFQLRSPENASPWLHRALDTLRTHPPGDDPRLEADVLSNLGEMHAVLGDFTQAVTVNKEASALYGKLENKQCRGRSFYRLAEAYRHLGDHHNSERYYHVAYQTLEDAGLQDQLWQVLEGLADLNYQRRQLDTSISYYKDTLSQLSHRRAPSALQEKVVGKLATALETQRVGVARAAAYKNRTPVLIQPEEDRHMAESVQSRLMDEPLAPSPIYAPLLSAERSLYSTAERSLYSTADEISVPGTSKKTPATLQVPGKRRKGKSKRHGRRRSGEFDKPVTRGVGEYDSETDISLVRGHRTSSRRSRRSRYSRQRSWTSQGSDGARTRPATHRLLSHIQGLEIDEDGSCPSEVPPFPARRGRSASQTMTTEDDATNSLTEVTSEEDPLGLSSESDSEDFSEEDSEEDSEDYSDDSEEELKFGNDSPRLGNTYEHPSKGEPMYATIKSRRLSSSQDSERLYETLNSTASTVPLTSSLPQREPPALPIAPDVPKGPRPSLSQARPAGDQAQEPALTSWSGSNYQDSSVIGTMSRGQRELGLYQVARLAHERHTSQSSGSVSSVTSDAKVPKSRACAVM